MSVGPVIAHRIPPPVVFVSATCVGCIGWAQVGRRTTQEAAVSMDTSYQDVFGTYRYAFESCKSYSKLDGSVSG